MEDNKIIKTENTENIENKREEVFLKESCKTFALLMGIISLKLMETRGEDPFMGQWFYIICPIVIVAIALLTPKDMKYITMFPLGAMFSGIIGICIINWKLLISPVGLVPVGYFVLGVGASYIGKNINAYIYKIRKEKKDKNIKETTD